MQKINAKIIIQYTDDEYLPMDEVALMKRRKHPARKKVVLVLEVVILLAGCGSKTPILDGTDGGQIQMTEAFRFEGEEENGEAVIDYNETNIGKIEQIRLPWEEPLPYFTYDGRMFQDFMWYLNCYQDDEFPTSMNIGAYGTSGVTDDEAWQEYILGDRVETEYPVRMYMMVIAEEGQGTVVLKEKNGKTVWESGALTQDSQFFLEFEQLDMEEPILEFYSVKTGEKNVSIGYWFVFYMNHMEEGY